MSSSVHYNNSLRFDLSAADISSRATQLVDEYRATADQVAQISDEERTFENTVLPLLQAERKFHADSSSLEFPQYVFPDKEIRDMSVDVASKLREFAVDLGMREDIFKALEAVRARGLTCISPEQERFVDRCLRDFRRNGLALPKEQREQVTSLKKRLSKLSIEFQRNLNEDATSVAFTRDELAGLDDSFIDGLKKSDDGKYLVTLQYPDLLPLMRKAVRSDTRQRMDFTNGRKCVPENVKILEEMIDVRRELAGILGYKTHADYVLEVRMAKNAETVMEFLSSLRNRLAKQAEEEKGILLALKKAICEENGESFDGELNSWDFQFLHAERKSREFNVKEDEIKEFFPMETVTSGMLEIYQELLGLRFERVPTEKAHVWHEDVTLYEVFDGESEAFLGQFYLDLHPRTGKYGHAAAFPLLPRSHLPGEELNHPAAAMVANFTKPTADRPSLLKHDEVVTYFHEFGHIMHNICTEASVARFSGTSVERDFVETPSQLFENWCWNTEVLQRMSGHYLDKAKKIPAELVESLIRAKNADSGLLYRRQLFFGLFDMTCHTSNESVNTEELWGKLRKEVTLVNHATGTNPSAGFGHIAGGYDAGYYGYLWSEVFSADIFSVFEKEGVMNPQLGRKLRRLILAPGGSKDASECLEEILGRKPQFDAFLRANGIRE